MANDADLISYNANRIAGFSVPTAGTYLLCYSPDGVTWCQQTITIQVRGMRVMGAKKNHEDAGALHVLERFSSNVGLAS